MCQFLQETYTNSSHKLLRLTVLIAQEMCYIGERLFVWPTDQSSVGSRCCNSFVSIYFVKKLLMSYHLVILYNNYLSLKYFLF